MNTNGYEFAVESTCGYYDIAIIGAAGKRRVIGSHGTRAGANAIAAFLSTAPREVAAAYANGIAPKS